MKICHVDKMRAMDQTAIEKYDIKAELLMENAGIAAFSVISQNYKIKNHVFTIICGTGNNGGDGLVVARKLISMHGIVNIFILGDPDKFHDSARLNYQIIRKITDHVHFPTRPEQIQNYLTETDCIIDAIFGTGLDREVGGLFADIITMINNSGKIIISLDIPSGVNGNTGEIMGVAVKATETITFGLPKPGNILYPGFHNCGRLHVSHISFPPELYHQNDIQFSVNSPIRLRERNPDSHKGSFGKVLFIAGSSQYLGAPYFAAMSFLKAGGGLSFLATPANISSYIAMNGNEIIMLPQKETPSGSISCSNKQELLIRANEADITVIGPGMSLDEETQKLIRELVTEIESPLLIDGDAITAVSKSTDILKQRKASTILTPHPGEMSRLVHVDINKITKSKIDILRTTCIGFNSNIVLKGAHTLIGLSNGEIVVNLTGNPGMATAGSGDILTGIIAAMVGDGYTLNEAVKLGVFLHGLAGDLAANNMGYNGMIARDILNNLPEALRAYSENYDQLVNNYYNKINIV